MVAKIEKAASETNDVQVVHGLKTRGNSMGEVDGKRNGWAHRDMDDESEAIEEMKNEVCNLGWNMGKMETLVHKMKKEM